MRVDDDGNQGVPNFSLRELLLLVSLNAVVFLFTCNFFHPWRSFAITYGDNGVYFDVASAIRKWDLGSVGIQHFMGYPYFAAAISVVLRLSPATALWLVAVTASIVSVLLTARLFGTWVAAYFALTNFAWIQASFLGGSEPLALALALGAFLAFRRDKWLLAALLASLSTTVRPLMVFTLVGMGLTLLYRRKYLQFLGVFAISVLVGALYVLPLALYFGDPFLTIHSYTSRDYGASRVQGPHGHLFGWPFHGIVVGTILYPGPWTNMVLSFFWIFLVLAGVALMFSKDFSRYARDHAAEVIFCGMYLLAIFSYDYLVWARSAFIRFCIPALPFVLFALCRYLPRRRSLLWMGSLASSILAAFSAIGIRHVFKF